MANEFLKSVVDLAVSPPERPSVGTPSPYEEDDPDRRHEKFGITRYTDPGYYKSAGQVAGSDDRSGSKFYSGTMGVSSLTGSVADNFVGMPKGLGMGLSMMGVSGFGVGAMMSLKNLSNIEEKMKAGEAGYGVGVFNNRIIGVSPGLFGGYTLSGVLPEGLTNKQRQQLIDSLLGISAGQNPPGDDTDGTPPGDDTTPGDDGDPTTPPGYNPDLPYDGYNPYPDEGNRPTPTPPSDGGGSGPNYPAPNPIDDVVPGDPPPSRPPSRPDNRPPQSDGGGGGGQHPSDPGGGGGGGGSSGGGGGGGGSSGGGGGGGHGTDNDPGYGGGYRASGGPVGFAEGGTTKKDPIQSTGFVDGPPQNYAKGTTVADTENHRVRVGSFVLNAPTTERLQKEGKLPKGPQKRRAAKGGKMMDVALSKGEYVIDVDDIDKFGGYDALNAENDKGKPEVDRRQAAMGGSFLDGYSEGGELPLSRIKLDNSTKTKFNTFLKSRRQRADVEKLIDSMDDRERLAVLALAETTAATDPVESMMGVGQTAINRARSNRRDFSKVNDLGAVMKQRSFRGSGSKMFQYDGLEPGVLSKRLTEVVKGQVPGAVTKMFSAADNLLNPETESDPIIPFDVMFYTTPDAPLAKNFERNPLLRYTKSFGGHDYYALDAAPEN